MALRKGLKLETIRVTVRRKNLWLDYVSSRNSHYSPSHTIKITFCGEPAIDDGGPKREFFSGKTGIILQMFLTRLINRLFSEHPQNYSRVKSELRSIIVHDHHSLNGHLVDC